MEKVTVGRVVHYVTQAGGDLIHQAAMVTAVDSTGEYVSLFIMSPYGERRLDTAKHSETPKLDTWHWPERV